MFYALVISIIGINIYVWHRLRLAFLRGHLPVALVLLLCMLSLLFMPLFMRMLFRHGEEPRLLAQASWTWLALAFWLFTAFLACGLWNTLADMACAAIAFLRPESIPPASPRLGDLASACIAISATALAAAWGIFEAGAVAVNRVAIADSRVPESASGCKILLVSDLHLGPAATEARVRKIAALIQKEKPDIILSAGDMIDGAGTREEKLASMLAQCGAPYGRFAVFGNHDVYSGLDFSRKCHGIAGFTLLEDSSATPLPWLFIHGETDPAAGWHPGMKGAARKMPPEPPDGAFSILLKHRPDVQENQAYSLQLSGHSHGGQIFPFNFLVRMQYPYREARLNRLAGRGMLYVSRGTGVWGPPFRLLARPEITLFTLENVNRP